MQNYPKKTEEAVRAHVFLTLLTLARYGIRRQRAAQYSSKVVLIAGESCAIFEIEEVFILLGVTPTQCFQVDPVQVRKRYGLSSLA